MSRTYICGPMSGYPDLNEPAFRDAAASVVERFGDFTVVPHDVRPRDHVRPCPPGPTAITQGEHSVACYLRADLTALLTCDRIYVLDGWEASVGARLEIQVAAACGLQIEFERFREAA